MKYLRPSVKYSLFAVFHSVRLLLYRCLGLLKYYYDFKSSNFFRRLEKEKRKEPYL